MAADHVISSSLSFIQVPHHGSRRNIGPEVLNKLVGNIVVREYSQYYCIYIMCASSDKHPHQSVINAFTRRGAKVVTTEGSNKRHSKMPHQERGGILLPSVIRS
jgi:beta-lactamase superfamily II metal-dependent hydrolase